MKKKEDEFLFFSKNFFEEKIIELINKKIIKVEFKNKLVFTNDNLTFFYDKLLIATGSINRQLNFNEVIDSNILYLIKEYPYHSNNAFLDKPHYLQ